jgi:DNA-binding IclR family transcriptional regulator
MERNEVSIQEVRTYCFLLKNKDRWVSHREMAEGSDISERTARSYTLKLVKIGILDLAEVFPSHRYRLSEKAAKRNAAYINRLEQACSVFGIDLPG